MSLSRDFAGWRFGVLLVWAVPTWTRSGVCHRLPGQRGPAAQNSVQPPQETLPVYGAHRPAGWPGLHPMGSQGSKRFKMQAHRVSPFHVSTCHSFATVPAAKAVLRPARASRMEGESRSGRKVLQSHQRDVYTDRGQMCGHSGRLT